MKIWLRFTVEERADRWLRRYTGPWRTALHEIGPVGLSWRYRYRPRVEFVRLAVAGHDLWTHALFREVVIPTVRPVVSWLARYLG